MMRCNGMKLLGWTARDSQNQERLIEDELWANQSQSNWLQGHTQVIQVGKRHPPYEQGQGGCRFGSGRNWKLERQCVGVCWAHNSRATRLAVCSRHALEAKKLTSLIRNNIHEMQQDCMTSPLVILHCILPWDLQMAFPANDWIISSILGSKPESRIVTLLSGWKSCTKQSFPPFFLMGKRVEWWDDTGWSLKVNFC